jgi:phenylalanyl-tRNA synthetase beta chain
MKVPYSWLREYVATDLEPRILAGKLTMAGLEVDGVEQRWHHIVTATIVAKEPIKGSDHLSATRISTGKGPELSVVCGAPNISVGDIVPLALPGAEFATDHDGEVVTIGVTKKRGVKSEGMLCSPRELGLSSDHTGIFLLSHDSPLGEPWDETIIELDIKAHRSDLFSMVGVAREAAAFNRTKMRLPEMTVPETGPEPASDLVRVTVEDLDLCPRFTARVISGVQIGPSPLWLVRRLAAAGVRSISNVVDITNYVMLELGQPLHAFDYDRVAGHQLIVRRARPGEQVRTLDDQLRDLTTDMMIICDASGPTSIAGVMGGATSEIVDTTTTVLLEAATWNGPNIRRTSARLGLRTEASSRFEKGLDPELARQGLDRAARLIAELASGQVAPGAIDIYPAPVKPRTIEFDPRDVGWLMGYDVSSDEAAEALAALEFGVRRKGELLRVMVPTWRGDVVESADIVEEIARVVGFERISGTIPAGPLPDPQGDNWHDREEWVRDILAGAGLREIVTYPLVSRASLLQTLSDAGDALPLLVGAVDNASDRRLPAERLPAIALLNPASARFEQMRVTLLPSALEIAAENIHQGTRTLRIFEIGRRYIPNTADEPRALPFERRSVAVVLSGPADEGWAAPDRPLDFYDLKGIAEHLLAALHVSGARYSPARHPTFHPGRCALIELPVSTDPNAWLAPAGVLGEVHPEVVRRLDLDQRAQAMEIDLDRVFAAVPAGLRFKPLSRFPALTRDLAVIVDRAVAAGDVLDAVRAAGGELLRSATLFDLYEGEPIPASQRSLAFTLVFQSDERTLSSADGDELRESIVAALRERFNAVPRE